MELLYIIIGFIIVGAIYILIDHRRMKQLALERGEANICEFVRSFDYRDIDTKIIREVWNELHEYIGKHNGKPFPIKAEDLFETTYKFDPDDLDDAYLAVAKRLRIDTNNPEKNPYWNKVDSVKKLVLFLHNQPRLEAHTRSTQSALNNGSTGF